jgi:hypothetical protein
MPLIDGSAAIEIARKRATEQGLPFAEPVRVIEDGWWFRKKPSRFDIGINVGDQGAMVYFTIDAKTGRVLREVSLAVGNKEAAIEVARKSAEEKEWSFDDRLEVIEHYGWFSRAPTHFVIHSNYGYYGANAHFTIDAKTGKILDEGYIPL